MHPRLPSTFSLLNLSVYLPEATKHSTAALVDQEPVEIDARRTAPHS